MLNKISHGWLVRFVRTKKVITGIGLDGDQLKKSKNSGKTKT
jgi:hypothetical protein